LNGGERFIKFAPQSAFARAPSGKSTIQDCIVAERGARLTKVNDLSRAAKALDVLKLSVK
jgi:hypothetical protein